MPGSPTTNLKSVGEPDFRITCACQVPHPLNISQWGNLTLESPVHARDDLEKILLPWKLLHVGGEGKKGRHLVVIVIVIVIAITIAIVVVIVVKVTMMKDDGDVRPQWRES